MPEYLLKMKCIVGILASVDHQISKDDKVLHVLSSLGSQYNAFVVSLTTLKI